MRRVGEGVEVLSHSGVSAMNTRPPVSGAVFLIGAFLATVAVLSIVGTIGWGFMGLFQ